MPFKAAQLADRSIELLRRWIDLGAPYDRPLVDGNAGDGNTVAAQPTLVVTAGDRQFWSFQPLQPVPIPKVQQEQWCRTPIDRFILAKQEAKGLHPNPPAAPRTLVRRATFDLLGLPATPEEVEAYVADADEDAWPKLIEQRLTSQHYGERWARHWMDVARFAESHGYEHDSDRPHAYHYRDFLIQAFNRDMPFDQFLQWQLAGDELAPDDPLAMMATGFLGAGIFPTQLTEAEFESSRYDELDDMVTTTGVTFLGLSVGCARCHDHKFDPIPSADYYRMAATFTTTIRSEIDIDLQPQENLQLQAAWDAKLVGLKQQLVDFEARHLPPAFADWLANYDPAASQPTSPAESVTDTPADTKSDTQTDIERLSLSEQADAAVAAAGQRLDSKIKAALMEAKSNKDHDSKDWKTAQAWFAQTLPRWQQLDIALSQHRDQGPECKLTKVMVTSEGLPPMKHSADGRGFPHFYPQTYLLNRGDVLQKQQVATAGFLQVLTPTEMDAAYWQQSPASEQPSTSFRRASLANWMTDAEHGSGSLVARVIVNRLWQHHFGRGLVATPSDFGASGDRPSHPELLDWLAHDLIAHNWQLKRLHRLIMTSSVYMQSTQHDAARAAVDSENRLLWRWRPRRLEAEVIRDSMLAVAGKLDHTMYGPGTLDQKMTRRSIYFFIKRSQLIPMLMLFDWPEHLVSIGQRSSTTIAPQALMFLNSQLGRECAEALASRLPKQSSTEAVSSAYRLAFSRLPTEREAALASAFLKRQAALHEQQNQDAAPDTALIDLCQSLLSMNEFIYLE